MCRLLFSLDRNATIFSLDIMLRTLPTNDRVPYAFLPPICSALCVYINPPANPISSPSLQPFKLERERDTEKERGERKLGFHLRPKVLLLPLLVQKQRDIKQAMSFPTFNPTWATAFGIMGTKNDIYLRII